MEQRQCRNLRTQLAAAAALLLFVSSIDMVQGIMYYPPSTTPSPPGVSSGDFVTRSGHQLMLRGQPFYFTGFNGYWLVDAASLPYAPIGGVEGRRRIAETFASAKALGLSVARTWAFNTQLPNGVNSGDPSQFEGLDYIVYCARENGLKLILALGNFWPAYKPPEHYVMYTTGSYGGGVLDFYRNTGCKQAYKNHINAVVNRINRYTGLAYKDDPTIMGYDVLNEPRCPACDGAEEATVVGWMDEMTRYTKSVAPKQLIALGTEGFFTKDSRNLNLVNPGAGAQCEGEDWPRIVSLPAVDFATLHVYERHLEQQPVAVNGNYPSWPSWFDCHFECYINWMVRYVKAHMEAAQCIAGDKPLIIEEFGLTSWRMDVRDRKVLLAVMYRLLGNTAGSGGNLAGAMLWNGAHRESEDQDGYNIRLDRGAKGIAAPPNLNPIPDVMSYLASLGGSSGRRLQQTGSMAPKVPMSAMMPPPAPARGERRLLSTRRLQEQMSVLDTYRRGPQRSACAYEASKYWRPPLVFEESMRAPSSASSEAKRWMALPDVAAWRSYAYPLEEVDLIKWGSSQVNKGGQV